jgi:hypothetical protein|mmetsp:Transcript_97129/g.163375  ORF Transcript_97129/g.163375 Transcript_97129/m.163375 type:complete len:109 (+) Transcript_97129:429-755(+)
MFLVPCVFKTLSSVGLVVPVWELCCAEDSALLVPYPKDVFEQLSLAEVGIGRHIANGCTLCIMHTVPSAHFFTLRNASGTLCNLQNEHCAHSAPYFTDYTLRPLTTGG